MSSSPVRVGLTPTPRIVSTPRAASRASDHEERGRREIAGHLERARVRAAPAASSRTRRRADVDAAAEAAQHALGVIARDGGLDHRRRALRVQAREQHRGLHLRARDRQTRSGCRAARAPPRMSHRRPARLRSRSRAPIWRSGVATRSIGRFISEASPISSLSKRWPASRPVIRRMAVPEFPMSSACGARLEPVQPDAVHRDLRAARSARSARRARALPRMRRQAIFAFEKAAHFA